MKIFSGNKFIILSLLMVFLFTGCAVRPVLYPNAHYKEVGKTQAEKDVDQAIKEADNADLNSGEFAKSATRTAGATALGAGVGAATGAISGGVGVGSIAGAIAGFTSSIFWSIFSSGDPSPIYKNYVDIKLQEEGYQVVGWK